ncbi:MAG: VWA domain-containing protein [Verrucomicrobiales bacterium]|nr:VWA domain-containing protein [Verrucomicrobiales bacterium]
MKLTLPPKLQKFAERLLEVDLSDKVAITPRTWLIWGGSILGHVILIAVLCRMVVFSGVHLGGIRGLDLVNASFQPYEGSFGVENNGGQKLYHVSTRMEQSSSLAGNTALITASSAAGEHAGNVPERPRGPQSRATTSKPVVGKNSFFGLRAEGKVIVFIIDVSGSMYEKTGTATRMARVFHELEQTVWSLAPDQKFNIVLFATRAVPLASTPINATEDNKQRASDWLNSDVDCGGTTNMGEGLALALAMKPEMILLLTDGEADSGPESIKSQADLLRKKFCPAVRICSVGFYLEANSVPEQLLRDLSGGTNGEYLRLRKNN